MTAAAPPSVLSQVFAPTVGALRGERAVTNYADFNPVFMAPIGVIGLCAQGGHGDLATARAAVSTGVPMVASTL
jgi:hypothetical protein